MAFSADQLARLTTGRIDYQYKVHVSGPRDTVAMQDIAEGQTFTAFPATTLNGALTNTSATITVVSTAGFDAFGYLLIDSDGTNPAEPIRYTGKIGTTFTGLTRDVPVAHLTGAAVSKWVDITARVTSLSFRETLQGEKGTWMAQLGGIDYDSRLLAQNNACLVMARWFPAAAGDYWSGWEVFFQGYIGAGTVSDDYRQGAEWQKPVRGIDFYLENADAPARRYGRANLALESSTSASTALVDASTIGHAGEVFGSPSLASDNLVDDSVSTVYCSVAIPQVIEGEPGSIFVGPYIAEVGIGPVGTGNDGSYFVVWVGTAGDTRDWEVQRDSIHNRQSLSGETYTGVGINTKDNGQLPTVSIGERIIFCRNREVFEQWAGPQDAEIIEWRSLQDASNFVLRKEGDWLSLSSNSFGGDNVNIRWGDEATGTAWAGLGALSEGQAYYRHDFTVNAGNNTDWTLTSSPVPGRNAQADVQAYASVAIPEFAITLAAYINNTATTITASPTTTGLTQTGGRIQIDSEKIDYISATNRVLTVGVNGIESSAGRGVGGTSAASHTTGADIRAVDGDGFAHETETIGRIGWRRKRVLASVSITSNINNSATTIPISTRTALTLPNGRIRIDGEEIDYADTTYFSLTGCTRGVNGTTATSHAAGAEIYVVGATETHRAENIVVPQDFTIWTSRQTSPAYPTTVPSVTTWKSDWTKQRTETVVAGVEWSTPDVWPSALAKHVMIVCDRMAGDTRFLLNELYALRAVANDPAVSVAETGGDVAEQMLTDFGLDADLIDVDAFGPVGTHLVTSKGRYMARLSELAKLMGGLVVVTRDNRVRFERSPWHPVAALPEVAVALSRSDGRLVRLEEGKRNVVAQIVLKANNPETGETFTAQYPPTARPLGSPVEVERTFYGSENEARYLAQMIYRQANSENGVIFTPAGHGEAFRVGQRVTLTWEMDRAGDLYDGRNFIVTGVAVQMEHPADGAKVCDWSVSLQEYIF